MHLRAKAFEEFANGGLEVLQEELRGARDVLETILLLVSVERAPGANDTEVFDLSKLIG